MIVLGNVVLIVSFLLVSGVHVSERKVPIDVVKVQLESVGNMILFQDALAITFILFGKLVFLS